MSTMPVTPQIVKAFENDPRTLLANSMMQTGRSTAPVATGKWAWADGLARALQGVGGAYIQKKTQKKYKAQEDEYKALLAQALGAAPDTPPAPQADSLPAPVAAPAPPQMAPQAPAAAPQSAPAPSPVPRAIPAPQTAPEAPPARPAFVSPVDGWTATPGQGIGAKRDGGKRTHTGRDWSGQKVGTPIPAPMDGEVIESGSGGKIGNFAKVKFADGSVHTIGHLASVPAKGPVTAGQEFAVAGNSGNASTRGTDRAVLHWTTRDAKGGLVDPANWMRKAETAGGQSAAPQQMAQAPVMPPQGPVTPEPELPTKPQQPNVAPAVQSQRLAIARRLINSGNAYAMELGTRMMEEGLGEQFTSDREATTRQHQTAMVDFEGATGDFYGARGDQRKAAYGARSDERKFGFDRYLQDDQQQWGTGERREGQQFQSAEAQKERTWKSAEAKLDRQERHWEKYFDRATAYEMALINHELDVKLKGVPEAERPSNRRTEFFNTATGARIEQKASETIKGNEEVIDQLKQFKGLNAGQKTGGALGLPLLGSAIGSLQAIGNPNVKMMDQISDYIAPKLREAGSGAMSDKDLAMFRNSLPNIGASRTANNSTADRIIRSMERMNDYERTRLEYIAQGQQVEFMKEWNAFKQSVPVASGKSFQDWKSSVVKYDAEGNRIQ